MVVDRFLSHDVDVSLSSLLLISVLFKKHIFFLILKRNLLEISDLGGVYCY